MNCKENTAGCIAKLLVIRPGCYVGVAEFLGLAWLKLNRTIDSESKAMFFFFE